VRPRAAVGYGGPPAERKKKKIECFRRRRRKLNVLEEGKIHGLRRGRRRR